MIGLSQIRPVDPVLNDFGIAYRQSLTAFAAEDFLPYTKTDGDTGTYFISDPLNSLRFEDPTWSYVTGASRVDTRFSSAAFRAQPWGLEEAVPDAYVRNFAGGGQALKERVTTTLVDKITLAREIRAEAIADAVAPGHSVTNKWGGGGSAANPRGEIMIGQVAIHKKNGARGNTIIFTGSVSDNLMGTASANSAGAAIFNSITYTNRTTGDQMNELLLSQYFAVSKVVLATAIQSDPTKYETTTVATAGLPEAGVYVWDKDEAYVFRSEKGMMSSGYGQTLGPDLQTIDQYRDDKVRADIVRVASTVIEKVTNSSAIYVVGAIL